MTEGGDPSSLGSVSQAEAKHYDETLVHEGCAIKNDRHLGVGQAQSLGVDVKDLGWHTQFLTQELPLKSTKRRNVRLSKMVGPG